jgi:hypothetical protein
MRRIGWSVAFVALILIVPARAANPPAKWTPNDWMAFVGEAVESIADYALSASAARAGVQSSLPLTEIYSVLMELPDLTKEALLRRLRVRMEAMAIADDHASLLKLNLYQAYYDSIATGDRSRLMELLRQQESARKSPAVEAIPDELAGHSPPPLTVEEIPEELVASGRPPVITNPGPTTRAGGRACDAAEQATFTQMTGSWRSVSIGPNATIGGACEQASGTISFREYCERPDAAYNKTLKSYDVKFTGRMEGGSLQLDWVNPQQTDPNHKTGTGSCHVGSGGRLECSGVPCRLSAQRQ